MLMQELYLFCFFCLGFILFRLESVRAFLGWDGQRGKAGKELEAAAPERASTLEQLRLDFAEARYERVLAAWPLLESYTSEGLSLVVTALVALGRVEDVGLFVAKAVAQLPHLRASLHETVLALARPGCELPQRSVVAALRDVFEKVRDDLGREAIEALLTSLAQLNDDDRVLALMHHLQERGLAASQQALEAAARGFCEHRNLDAALMCVRRQLSRGGMARGVLLEVAQACLEEEEEDAARAWDALELLEAVENVPTGAIAILVEHLAQKSLFDAELVQRTEQRLRAVAGGAALPASTYDALVRLHASAEGNGAKALAVFEEWVARGKGPSEGSLVGMLSACFDAKNGEMTERICRWAREGGRCTLPVFSAGVKALGAARLPLAVCELYEAVEGHLELDQAMYGQLIKFAVQAGRLELARAIFKLARNPDTQNYMSLMRACSQEGKVGEALSMLWDLSARGQADTAAYNSALDACVSNGDREQAAEVFRAMRASCRVDVVSYNILLKQYIGEKDAASLAQVDALFREMEEEGLKPNTATYNSLLGGALAAGDFGRAWQTIDLMEGPGPGIDAYTISILFKGYKGKRSVMDPASFDRALELIEKYSVKVDEVLVNVALEACVGLRDPSRLNSALSAFRRSGWALPRLCNMHTYATLIKAYGQSRQLGMAWKLWGDITSRKGLVPTEQLYSQMIDVLVTNEHLDNALVLFEEMKGTHPNHGSQGFAVAYAMIIKGFAQRKECAKALQCYGEMRKQGTHVGLIIFNTLIDGCSRVGDMDTAARLFHDMMDARCVPDLITYSTLIKGYCVRGELDQAMELFSCMRRKGILPDAIVFNSLLDGCAKKQMPALCEQVIRDMEEAGVSPSNHSASILIKLYGRQRDLDAAFGVINDLPRKYNFRLNAAVYTCLMSACICNNRLDLAMGLRRRMLDEGTHLDEKAYSTLLRGAVRVGNVDNCLLLIDAALNQGGRRFLDEELVQSACALVQRKCPSDERGPQLAERLRSAGVRVRPLDRQPQHASCQNVGRSPLQQRRQLGAREASSRAA